MQLNPLRGYRDPMYPTLEEYFTKKSLKKTVRRAAVLAAVAALTALSGCISAS